MYATKKEPLYVGATGRCTIKKRYDSKLKEKNGSIQWIKKNIKEKWRVKVGYMHYMIKCAEARYITNGSAHRITRRTNGERAF